MRKLVQPMETMKCKTCANAPEHCGSCRPPFPLTCSSGGGTCKGKITREFCDACQDDMAKQIRQLNERLACLMKDEKERQERMKEMTSRMEESLKSVRAMQDQLVEKDADRNTIGKVLDTTEQELLNSQLQLIDKEKEIRILSLKLNIANESVFELDTESVFELKRRLECKSETVIELKMNLDSKNLLIDELEMQLTEKDRNALGKDALQSLCATLCETVRNEMLSFQPKDDSFQSKCDVYHPGSNHRSVDKTFFFDGMQQGPQTTWEDLENLGNIVEVKEGEGEKEIEKEKEKEEKDDIDLVCVEVKQDQEPQREEPQEKDQPLAPAWTDLFTLSDYKNGIKLVGDTKPHKKELLVLHGKWNHKLNCWFFSKKRQDSIETFLETVASNIAEKEASNKRKEERNAKRTSKLKYNEDLNVYVDKKYEILFHPETRAAFAHMDDDEEFHSLTKLQINDLEGKGYSVMDKRERKKYLDEYLEKTEHLTEKLVPHPTLHRYDDYMMLESYPYLFTSDKVAFCKLEAEECQSLSGDDISWLKRNDFEYLSKRDRRREIHKVKGFLEELKDEDSDIDSSESDVDLSDSD